MLLRGLRMQVRLAFYGQGVLDVVASGVSPGQFGVCGVKNAGNSAIFGGF